MWSIHTDREMVVIVQGVLKFAMYQSTLSVIGVHVGIFRVQRIVMQ